MKTKKKQKNLKMFVWEDIFCDYTSGMACALAHDVEEARWLITNEIGADEIPGDLLGNPRIVTKPSGFSCRFGSSFFGGS
jgi:hypothetical protein